MFEHIDAESILRLAMSSVPTLGSYRALAGYLERRGELVEFRPGRDRVPASLTDQLGALRGKDGPVLAAGSAWAWAFALRRPGGLGGYLVLTGPGEPAGHERFLLDVLTQQTAAALANASFLQVEREHAMHLSRLSEDLAVMNRRLTSTVEDLRRRATIHETFTRIAASDGGEDEIAATLHQLTGSAVAVEDRFGNLLAWAGPGGPDPHPQPNGTREETLRRAAARNGVVRDRNRLLILAQPRHEILGVIALLDPGPTEDAHVVHAMEHAALALALRLTHARNLAETELRLRRDLVEDLVAGVEDQSVFARSEAVGHNLHGPHYAIAVQWPGAGSEDELAAAAQRAVQRTGMSSLVSRRSEAVILFNSGRPDGEGFYRALAEEIGSDRGAIGVGGRCDAPGEFPRSFREALRSMRIRQQSRECHGITFFDEIGLYRVLGQGEGGADIEAFVREWIGRLVDYDRAHHSNLVNTLSQYLECGGNYNAAANALVIHRSTLRYRLRRIREISGIDLGEVDNRLNLHVATRAWRVMDLPA
ncbi:helix-turn-helix domain-containing protein [Saccharopolyspora erythraea]|nr:helix-turn-helix domain-containing protein [Saccharopolyspora erythraea]